MSNKTYTLGILQNIINNIISIKELNVVVTPLEPPMVQIIKGKKIINQKLGKFLKANTVYTDDMIKTLVENYKEINSDLSSYKVKYTTNYVDAYKTPLYALDSTCVSCMTGEDCVRIYDYDERLKLLTIYKNSQLIGRTLVRTDLNEYVRIYIDHNHLKSHVANAIIEKEGFKKGNLLGIKLQYIEEGRTCVAPYLDGYQNLEISDDETHLIIGTGSDYKADQTNGYACNAHTVQCDCCGYDECDKENMYYVDNQAICEDCLNENYVYIDDIGDYVHNDYVTLVESNDTYYHVGSSEITYVESENAYFLNDDVVEVNGNAELLENCEELVDNYNHEGYALKDDAIFVDEDFEHIVEGYYLREQLEAYIVEIEEKLEHVQTDLIDDVEETLRTELEYIQNLL